MHESVAASVVGVWRTQGITRVIKLGSPSPVGNPQAFPWGVSIHNPLNSLLISHRLNRISCTDSCEEPHYTSEESA